MKDPKGPPIYQHDVTVCRPNDVVLERGGFSNKHPGNKTLRRIVQRCKKWYKFLEETERLFVVEHLMTWCNFTHRTFVVRLRAGTAWKEASREAARESLLHMLRENNTKAKGIRSKGAKKSPSELEGLVCDAIKDATASDNQETPTKSAGTVASLLNLPKSPTIQAATAASHPAPVVVSPTSDESQDGLDKYIFSENDLFPVPRRVGDPFYSNSCETDEHGAPPPFGMTCTNTVGI
ncbi:unnamed protein product [Cylindrotheca closterium]|uniref:DUF6824 domain-containing protein n=1 Tax=Cylindrotheca closterium TaxID=2856 RepID=A0AAD2JIN0_9STRA|nr:unnamed protein product [Cylindrotheca closterium]CAJ1953959.1 unnamed protein product [Cylindrotheca closterium]